MQDRHLFPAEGRKATPPSPMPYVLFSVLSLAKACVNSPDPISLTLFSLQEPQISLRASEGQQVPLIPWIVFPSTSPQPSPSRDLDED